LRILPHGIVSAINKWLIGSDNQLVSEIVEQICARLLKEQSTDKKSGSLSFFS